MRIELIPNEYYLEEDALNFILIDKHEVKVKKDEESDGRTTERVVGYYKTVCDALARFLELYRKKNTLDLECGVKKYCDEIKRLNDEALSKLTLKVIESGLTQKK